MSEKIELNDEDFILIGRYLNGVLGPAELSHFKERMKKEPGLQEAVNFAEEIWEMAPSINSELTSDPAAALKRVHQRIQARAGEKGIHSRSRWLSQPLKIAVSIAFILALTTFFWMRDAVVEVDSSSLVHQLPDGTIVYLAQGSTLQYPKRFGDNQRTVTLKGQAYFDVTSEKGRPFIVNGVRSKIKVLGTEFDLTMDSIRTLVSVAEGRVEMSSLDGDLRMVLNAGEAAAIDLERNVISKKDAAPPLTGTWATGNLIFNQVPMAKLVQSLNEYFHADIRLEGPHLEDCVITTRFDQPELSEVIEEVALLLSLKVEYHDSKIMLSGSGCKIE